MQCNADVSRLRTARTAATTVLCTSSTLGARTAVSARLGVPMPTVGLTDPRLGHRFATQPLPHPPGSPQKLLARIYIYGLCCTGTCPSICAQVRLVHLRAIQRV